MSGLCPDEATGARLPPAQASSLSAHDFLDFVAAFHLVGGLTVMHVCQSPLHGPAPGRWVCEGVFFMIGCVTPVLLTIALLTIATAEPLLCDNTCRAHGGYVIEGCVDSGPPLGNVSSLSNGSSSQCALGTQCAECGVRGQALVNESHHLAMSSGHFGAITAKVSSLASKWRQSDAAAVTEDELHHLLAPGSCAALSGGGGALCCSALDNSATPYRGQACLPLPAAHAPTGSRIRCVPSGWMLSRMAFLPVSCADIILGGKRKIIAQHVGAFVDESSSSTTPLQLRNAKCASLPSRNDALCCAALEGRSRGPVESTSISSDRAHERADTRHDAFYGQPCVPSRPGATFTTGSTCEPASWVVAHEPQLAGSCAQLSATQCLLPKGVGCNERSDGCCGYKVRVNMQRACRARARAPLRADTQGATPTTRSPRVLLAS